MSVNQLDQGLRESASSVSGSGGVRMGASSLAVKIISAGRPNPSTSGSPISFQGPNRYSARFAIEIGVGGLL